MFSDVKGARLPMSCSTQWGEPTSKYFCAHLGEATAEVEARLLQWAAGCVAHSLARDERSQVSFYFERAEARTVRQMQSLLRTLSAKWKLPLGQLDRRWLRALASDEFREKVLADKAKSVPARSVAELERAEITYLTSLGPDFAERSRALLIALRAKKAAC